MGLHFNANHGNIVVYLTTPAAEPPRVERGLLREFLEGLVTAAGELQRGESNARDERDIQLISSNARWLRLIALEAGRAASAVEAAGHEGEYPVEPLSRHLVARTLAPLAQLFSQFRLYALLLARAQSRQDVSEELKGAAVRLARSHPDVLVLFPEGTEAGQPRLDALPAYALALAEVDHWPGILFWSNRGVAAFTSGAVALEAAARFSQGLSEQPNNELDRSIGRLQAETHRRLLHISDLHFGSQHASINAEYVEAELSEVARNASRVVITGDLIETPNDAAAADYRRFSNALQRSSGKPVIVVPGNHDQRFHGNAMGRFGRDLEQVAQLNWATHVIDDDMKAVFLCFNSSLTGKLARGQTGARQLTRVAGEHRTALAAKPELRDYLTVALIHHHPYSFEASADTWYQRMLSAMRLSDEPTLRMVDADAFVEWCARWRVSTVLHGHKHVPRYESRTIAPAGTVPFEVTAIGCGSTLGAEGTPLSYCMLHWDPIIGRWSATFYESRGGGPFLPALITVTRDSTPPAPLPPS